MPPKCRICHEPYDSGNKQPLSLPCGHTFCKTCLGQLHSLSGNNTIKCPTCRGSHNVPNLSSLTVNYDLLSASITSTQASEDPSSGPGQISSTGTIAIVIKDITDQTFRLKVMPTATIKSVKEDLQAQHGFQPQNTRLLFRGRRLDDNKTLRDYNIQNGNILQMVMTFLGGVVPLLPPPCGPAV